MTTQAQYFIERRFGETIVSRLARDDKSVAHLARYLGRDEADIMQVFNGHAPLASAVTFQGLDTYFGTRPGYFEEVYKNCYAILLKETESNFDDSKVPAETVQTLEEAEMTITMKPPKGYMLVPIEMVRGILEHMSAGHDHCDESLELWKMADAVEKEQGE